MSKNAGFTLIELLVVVLIIGVLASVALPQYTAAVQKSRVMSFMPAVRAIKEAQERYYMANGFYALKLEDLDISIPGGCRIRDGAGNQVLCGEDWVLDNLGSGGSNPHPIGQLELHYCSGNNTLGTASCNNNTEKGRIMLFYDYHSINPGKISCASPSRTFCSSMQSVLK